MDLVQALRFDARQPNPNGVVKTMAARLISAADEIDRLKQLEARVSEDNGLCTGCGAALTGEERHYYGLSCERCERADTYDEPDMRDEKIRQLETDLAEARRLIEEAPALVIDHQVARLRAEHEAVAYADAMARWVPRAKALLSRHVR